MGAAGIPKLVMLPYVSAKLNKVICVLWAKLGSVVLSVPPEATCWKR